MKETIFRLYENVVKILGSGENLEDECETTTCYTIASLYKQYGNKLSKIEGTFNGKGHFWCEINDDIIDLSVEQFGVPFQYPLSDERKHKYLPRMKQPINEEIIQDSIHIAEISGFNVNECM